MVAGADNNNAFIARTVDIFLSEQRGCAVYLYIVLIGRAYEKAIYDCISRYLRFAIYVLAQ